MKRRFKTFLKWAAIATGVVLVAFFLWSAASTWSSGRRLEQRLDALRKAGDPLSIADYARTNVPDDVNADVLLEQVAGELESVEKELTALYPKVGRPSRPLAPEERPRLEDLFQRHPRVIPTLLEAAGRPDYAHAFDVAMPTTLFTNQLVARTGRDRAAVRVLETWSMILTARGDRDEALAVGVASLRLSRHWGRDPGFISALASIACSRVSAAAVARVLRDGPVAEPSRRTLDAELARQDDGEIFRLGLKSERAYALTSIREMSESIFWLKGWMLNNLTLMFLDFFDEELSRADLAYPQVRGLPASSAIDGYWHPLKPLAILLRPAIKSFREATERHRAAIRTLRVLNALQAHVPADVASPPGLETTSLPREATLDPFSGSPFIVKKLPAGWLVYSVGADLKDDGGELEKDQDVGFGPAER